MRRSLPALPVTFVALAALLIARASPAPAQAARPLAVETDLLKEPGGVQLLHMLKGTPLVATPAKSGGFAATIDGWIPENALHDDKRDGFDISVSLPAGTTLRDKPSGNPLASARLGALFDKVEAKNGWVHVKRTGWVIATAFAVPVAGPPVAAPSPAATAPATQLPVAGRGTSSITTTVAAGAALAAQPGGAAVATLESPLHATVIEHKEGWAHVQVDAWVKDAALGNAPAPTGITAADIRAAPDKYLGQTVEWTVQLLGIQKADELRPELPAGQPYLLARGPLPESGFVYIAVTSDEAETFRKLEPLAKIRIRATIRAGKSRFLPTPVLNFVRRLD
jgi:hypothetical protein